MDSRIERILDRIGDAYGHKVGRGSRHYLTVSIADQARQMGYADLSEKYWHAHAVVPLERPEPGMKVRIDGRTFVDYAQYPPGIAIPGYLARQTSWRFTPYQALDSMICNFS